MEFEDIHAAVRQDGEAPAADPAPAYPAGDYAIVEIMGHRTIVGRISEVIRFGTTMLQIEPIWQDGLLPGVMISGASIYQLTPCTAATAFAEQPKHHWQLPSSIGITVPKPTLPAPAQLEPVWIGVDLGVEDRESF